MAARVRAYKRLLSDQQRRREVALERQEQARRDLRNHARQLASHFPYSEDFAEPEKQPTAGTAAESELGELRCPVGENDNESNADEHSSCEGLGFSDGAKLRGARAKKWWSQQLLLPEWMVDIPPHMNEW